MLNGLDLFTGIGGISSRAVRYVIGETTVAHAYNDDPMQECAAGIHFFVSQLEAEEW